MDLPLNDSGLDPAEQARRDRARLLRGFSIAASLVALLWWIAMWQQISGNSLRGLALYPGAWHGLIGILTAPLLHGSFAHLVSNTLPLLILGTLAFATLPRAAPRALALIWLLSGLGTWLIGRESAHLGASGLGHGLMLFVFVAGLVRRDRAAIAAALIAFFFYGGMLASVFPGAPEVSWEYHLCGAIAGLLAALCWGRLDPLPPRKRYSWEDEEESLVDQNELEPPSPQGVPVLWQRVDHADDHRRGVVIPFPRQRDREPPDP